MSWKKYLVIPKLIYYAMRAPKTQGQAWDRFWSGIERTGKNGQVLWDEGSEIEFDAVLSQMRTHMDASLPFVDLGCGNGRHTRVLGAHFPKALGLDVSSHAIARAVEETPEAQNTSFRVLDVTGAGVGQRLVEELGEMNIYMRGVLHVLDRRRRAATIQNLKDMLGRRGVAYLTETNIEGNPLDHLEFQGATPTYMPEPLRLCIEAGITPPSHFGERELRTYFPVEEWDVLVSDKTLMHGVKLFAEREIEHIPSFYAIVRPRHGTQPANG